MNDRILVTAEPQQIRPLHCQQCRTECHRDPETCRVMKQFKEYQYSKTEGQGAWLAVFMIIAMLAASFVLDYFSMVLLNRDAAMWALFLAIGAVGTLLTLLLNYRLDCKKLVGTRD